MNFDCFKKIIEDSVDFGAKKIQITGGEPLLHPKFKDFLKLCAEYDLETLVVTNGYALSSPVSSSQENQGYGGSTVNVFKNLTADT